MLEIVAEIDEFPELIVKGEKAAPEFHSLLGRSRRFCGAVFEHHLALAEQSIQ